MSKHRPLTAGEQAVWAAAFTQDLARSTQNTPRGIYVPGNEEAAREWEAGNVSGAVECAGAIIQRLRDGVERTREGWGEDSDNFLFHAQMAGQPRTVPVRKSHLEEWADLLEQSIRNVESYSEAIPWVESLLVRVKTVIRELREEAS